MQWSLAAAFVATARASSDRSDNDEWAGRAIGSGGCLGSARAILRRSDLGQCNV
jgi:hypothetical protein